MVSLAVSRKVPEASHLPMGSGLLCGPAVRLSPGVGAPAMPDMGAPGVMGTATILLPRPPRLSTSLTLIGVGVALPPTGATFSSPVTANMGFGVLPEAALRLGAGVSMRAPGVKRGAGERSVVARLKGAKRGVSGASAGAERAGRGATGVGGSSILGRGRSAGWGVGGSATPAF